MTASLLPKTTQSQDLPQEEKREGQQEEQQEQRIFLHGVSWQDYLALDAILENVPGTRLTYLQGTLQIMTVSPKHEAIKTTIGRLLEMYSFVENISINGYGSTTYRREALATGLEPDECYCVGSELKERPDFAIEVVITSGGINKLELYRGLGVPEVWFWEDDAFSLYALMGETYQAAEQSQFFPQLDLAMLSQYVQPFNQSEAVRAFYETLNQA